MNAHALDAPIHSIRVRAGSHRATVAPPLRCAPLQHALCGQGAREAARRVVAPRVISGGLSRRQRREPNGSLQSACHHPSPPPAPVGRRRIFVQGPLSKMVFAEHLVGCAPVFLIKKRPVINMLPLTGRKLRIHGKRLRPNQKRWIRTAARKIVEIITRLNLPEK